MLPAMKPDTGSNDGSQEQTGLHQENGKYYYVNENGERVSDQWVTVNGKTYYISSDGYALMGMKKSRREMLLVPYKIRIYV